MDTTDMAMVTMATMARGLLMLNLPLSLKPIHSSLEVTMDITLGIDTDIIMDMAMVTMPIMARGLLMLNLLLLLMLIHSSLDVAMYIIMVIVMDIIMVMAMVTMATMARGLLMLRLLLLLMLIHSSLDVVIIITMATGIIMAMATDTMDNEEKQTKEFMCSDTKSSVIDLSHGVGS